jgi:hypothetical protein
VYALAIGPLAQVCLHALTVGRASDREQATRAPLPGLPAD